MCDETPENLDTCPLCMGELKFILISLEEELKVCLNTQCPYPLVSGFNPEFRPVKMETEEEDHDISLTAILKKYWKSAEEWDKLFNESEKNLQEVTEMASKLDELTAAENEIHFRVTNKRLSDIEELFDLFDEPSKTSDSDAGKTEVNGNSSDEDCLDSFMSELEKTQSNETNQKVMQWNVDDFEADILEINNVDKNEVIPHSEDNDVNVNVIAEQDCGAFSKASEDVPLAVCCTSITAKESKVQNDSRIINCTLEVGTENIPSLSTNQIVSASTATSSNDITSGKRSRDFETITGATVKKRNINGTAASVGLASVQLNNKTDVTVSYDTPTNRTVVSTAAARCIEVSEQLVCDSENAQGHTPFSDLFAKSPPLSASIAAEEIKNNPGVFPKVHQNWPEWCEDSGYMEYFL